MTVTRQYQAATPMRAMQRRWRRQQRQPVCRTEGAPGCGVCGRIRRDERAGRVRRIRPVPSSSRQSSPLRIEDALDGAEPVDRRWPIRPGHDGWTDMAPCGLPTADVGHRTGIPRRNSVDPTAAQISQAVREFPPGAARTASPSRLARRGLRCRVDRGTHGCTNGQAAIHRQEHAMRRRIFLASAAPSPLLPSVAERPPAY
jgi:hypothetical protein